METDQQYLHKLMSITDLIDKNIDYFVVLLITISIIAGIFCILFVLQLFVMPTRDLFVKKASIYIGIGALVRCCSSIAVIFSSESYYKIDSSDHDITGAFIEAMISQFGLEVPVCIYLTTTISLLFAFYRIYLTLQDVLGLNLPQQNQ